MSSPREIQEILAALQDEPAGLATLIAVSGSSYRQTGARCLVLGNGRAIGSISGGCLEEDVRFRAARALSGGDTEVVTYDTASENDLVWGTGLGCLGEVRVFFERLAAPAPDWIGRIRENFGLGRQTHLRVSYAGGDKRALGTRLHEESPPHAGVDFYDECIPAPPSIVVFGAGDDAIPLVQFACRLGWHVTVLDSRATYATKERFSEAQSVAVAAPEVAAMHQAIDQRSHVIVMSHRYRDDTAFLRAILPRSFAYLGVLGPRQRTERILDEIGMTASGGTPEILARLYAPVGLDLGGASPETVALSIIAELQAIQTRRVPVHLRDVDRAIHG